MKQKYFIITIDTEGDNLWNYKDGDIVTTENVKYLQRFQDLCNKYHYKPVWLADYEMVNDDRFVSFAKAELSLGHLEIGIHIHAWNNPPIYKFDNLVYPSNASYLIEYPDEVMFEKIKYLYNFISERIGCYPFSHRAGRWATNETYLKQLEEIGIKVDCSITPYIDWSNNLGQTKNSKGSNYKNQTNKPFFFGENNELLMCPTTIVKKRHLVKRARFLDKVKRLVKPHTYWLRPSKGNLEDMLYVANKCQNNDYLMFMIHSSELMPGCNHRFQSEEDINNLYRDLESLFSYLSKEYVGITLKEFYQIYKKQ